MKHEQKPSLQQATAQEDVFAPTREPYEKPDIVWEELFMPTAQLTCSFYQGVCVSPEM